MPVAQVVCAICGMTSTKRRTLSLRELGGTLVGRACRSHQEVIALKDARARDREFERTFRQMDESLRVIQGVELVRLMHSLYGLPEGFIYESLRLNGMRPEVIERIRTGVDARGGPLMSVQELGNAIVAGLLMGAKKEAAKEASA